jgi:hypothetical protein
MRDQKFDLLRLTCFGSRLDRIKKRYIVAGERVMKLSQVLPSHAAKITWSSVQLSLVAMERLGVLAIYFMVKFLFLNFPSTRQPLTVNWSEIILVKERIH